MILRTAWKEKVTRLDPAMRWILGTGDDREKTLKHTPLFLIRKYNGCSIRFRRVNLLVNHESPDPIPLYSYLPDRTSVFKGQKEKAGVIARDQSFRSDGTRN